MAPLEAVGLRPNPKCAWPHEDSTIGADGQPRFIEVKTTTFGDRTPFFVSSNELAFSRQKANEFRLYRLFDFRAAPRMFELAGPVDQHCVLDPMTYRASFG